MHRRDLAISAALGLLLFAAHIAAAQSATGKILGRVADPHGAGLPQAKVTLTNTATKVSHETRTDNEGDYQFIDLPIGSYPVHPEMLQINQNLRVDLRLPVGPSKPIPSKSKAKLRELKRSVPLWVHR